MITFQNAAGVLPANARNLALEVSNSSLPCVMTDDMVQGGIFELNLVQLQATVLTTSRDEVITCDLNFFFLGVAREFDDFHTITKRGRNRVDHIRCGDEKDAREIECDVKIVVPECRILLGVENLEQRRRRITSEIGA